MYRGHTCREWGGCTGGGGAEGHRGAEEGRGEEGGAQVASSPDNPYPYLPHSRLAPQYSLSPCPPHLKRPHPDHIHGSIRVVLRLQGLRDDPIRPTYCLPPHLKRPHPDHVHGCIRVVLRPQGLRDDPEAARSALVGERELSDLQGGWAVGGGLMIGSRGRPGWQT